MFSKSLWAQVALGFAMWLPISAKAQDAAFYQCYNTVVNFCNTLGQPSTPLPYYTSSTGPALSTNHPLPPPGFTGDIMTFDYNCNYTNSSLPGPYPNSLSGFIYKCGYRIDNPLPLDPDLKIESIVVDQIGATVENGLLAILPDKDVRVIVTISGKDIKSTDTRNVTFALSFGDQISTELIPVNALSGTTVHTKTYRFSIQNLGQLGVIASINRDINIHETDYDNNEMTFDAQLHCSVSKAGRTVRYWKQSDRPWGPTPYDHSTGNMSGLGCLITSSAMLFDSYGLKKDHLGNSFNPQTLNEGLKKFTNFNNQETNGFDPKNNLLWARTLMYGQVSFKKQCELSGGTAGNCKIEAQQKLTYEETLMPTYENLTKVGENLCAGNPILLKIPGVSTPTRDHFVLAKATTVIDGKLAFVVNDPARGEDYLFEDIEEIRGAFVYKQKKDPSMFFLNVYGDVELVVTDPSGRKTGYNPIADQTFNEIISGAYISNNGIQDLDLADGRDDSTSANKEFHLPNNVMAGNFKIQVFGNVGSTYTIYAYGYDNEGQPNQDLQFSGTIDQTRTKEHLFIQTNNPLPPPITQNAKINTSALIILERPKKTEDRFVWTGQIKAITPKSILLNFQNKMTIKVGEQIININRAQFKSIGIGNLRYYSYSSSQHGGINIKLLPNGLFYINIKNISELQTNNINLELGIDELYGSTDLKLKCSKYICTAK